MTHFTYLPLTIDSSHFFSASRLDHKYLTDFNNCVNTRCGDIVFKADRRERSAHAHLCHGRAPHPGRRAGFETAGPRVRLGSADQLIHIIPLGSSASA